MLKKEFIRIDLELKQIKELLKNSGQKIDSMSGGQNANNIQGNQVQNNYYSISNPSVKIELKEPYKIYIFELLKNEQIKDILFIAILPFFILTIFISFSVESLNLFKFIQILLSYYIILAMGLFSFNFIQMINSSYKAGFKKINYILIDKVKLQIIKEKETKIIDFKDIRKIEIEKNYMIGYNILVYNKQLKATLRYNVHYREKALLIKELFEEYLLNQEI